MIERIITRPDFDGVVCAVLLKEACADVPVLWVQPNDIQRGLVAVTRKDVVANLPFSRPCALWFDHHVSNRIDIDFEGLFRIAPSAAGLVHAYFDQQLTGRYTELVRQADKIDSADLTLDEIIDPERHPYVLVSMTIDSRCHEDLRYCDHLVYLLRRQSVETIVADPDVARRCRQAISANREYENLLRDHTIMRGHVSVSDFRNLTPAPEGNRFLVYSLFPAAVVNVKVFHDNNLVAIKVGHSILNRGCRVNVGRLLAHYGGGGHKGAGACRVPPGQADRFLEEIIQVLLANEPGPVDD